MIIHVHPDLDAITCVALASVDVDYVHMLPAGIEKLPDVCPCHGRPLDPRERILDHPLGDKGRLDPDGTRRICSPKSTSRTRRAKSTSHDFPLRRSWQACARRVEGAACAAKSWTTTCWTWVVA